MIRLGKPHGEVSREKPSSRPKKKKKKRMKRRLSVWALTFPVQKSRLGGPGTGSEDEVA